MDTSTLGGRLKLARKRLHWRQEDLAEESDVKQSTISKLEREVQKTTTEVAVLAHHLGVSAVWLSDKIGPMISVQNTVSVSSDSNKMEDVMIYQYADPRCSEGLYSGDLDKDELQSISVSKATLDGLSLKPEECIAYIQPDSSGGLTLAEDDEGLITTKECSPALHNGKLFAIAIGENVIIRRITTKTLGGCLISSENIDKSRFPDEHLSADELEKLNIIGRLCWSSGRK